MKCQNIVKILFKYDYLLPHDIIKRLKLKMIYVLFKLFILDITFLSSVGSWSCKVRNSLLKFDDVRHLGLDASVPFFVVNVVKGNSRTAAVCLNLFKKVSYASLSLFIMRSC